MNKIMELIRKAYETHIAWGQDSATLGDVDDATQAVEAEVTRMEAELERAYLDAVADKKVIDELRAKLAALEAQKPAYWVGQSGNLYAGRLFAVQNGEQMVTPLYLAAGAKEKP